MKVLVFDTETTGLPLGGKNIPVYKTDFFPYIVQFSWATYDTCSTKLNINDYIIQIPEDEDIPEDSIKVHGITNEIMRSQGLPIKPILRKFTRDLFDCDIIVAHNLPFDKKIVSAELIRNGQIDWLSRHRKKEYCTLRNSIDLCCIKVKGKNGNYYNKWPKLMELHKHLFRSVPNNLHNSLVDIFVCLRCFHKLYYDTDLLRKGKELRTYYDELCGFTNKYKL